MPSETDIAYAAGIVDGEGSIVVSYKPKTSSCQISVSVSMSKRNVPDWLKATFGGHNVEELNHQGYGGMHAQRMYRWRVNGIYAQQFCEVIASYLKDKKVQAELLCLVPKKPSGHHLSDEERNIQIELADQVSSINSRKGVKRAEIVY